MVDKKVAKPGDFTGLMPPFIYILYFYVLAVWFNEDN